MSMPWFPNIADGQDCLRLPRPAREDRYRATFPLPTRLDLARIGLSEAQIELLEPALRVIKWANEKAPPISEVRAPLQKLQDQAEAIAETLKAMRNASAKEKALQEARKRIDQAALRVSGTETDETFSLLDQIQQSVSDLVKVSKRATSKLPKDQSRHYAAPYPIAYINDALRIGYQQKMAEPGQKGKYPFPVSRAARSRFRRIAELCYETAIDESANPEAAIRNFMKSEGNSG